MSWFFSAGGSPGPSRGTPEATEEGFNASSTDESAAREEESSAESATPSETATPTQGTLRRSNRKRKQTNPYARPDKKMSSPAPNPFKSSGMARTPNQRQPPGQATAEEPMTTDQPPPQPTPSAMPAPANLLEEVHKMISGLEGRLEAKIASRISDAEKRTASRLKKMNDDIAKRLDGAEASIGRLEGKQQGMDNKIEEIRKEAEKQASELPARVEDLVARSLNGGREGAGPRPRRPTARGSATAATGSAREEKYWEARRSLKLWPIIGQDIKAGVEKFLRENLDMPREEVEDLAIVAKKQQLPLRRGGESTRRQEALVTFGTVEERDRVRSMARNLKDKDAGIDIYVPDHLRRDQRALQAVAYRMKRKNPALKRNVLFDDMTLGLLMHFTVDGTDWKTVTAEEAVGLMADRNKKNVEQTARINDMMGETSSSSGSE